MVLLRDANKPAGNSSGKGAYDEVTRVDTKNTLGLEKTTTRSTMVEGTSRLYENGQRQFVPMPTADPKDPLNLSDRRKLLIISALCFFGAMALAAEAIIAALLPIFVLEYNNIPPSVINGLSGLPQARGGGVIPDFVGSIGFREGPPLWKITLIATLPVLVIGVSNYFLVPLSVAVGRRPVIIVCGLMAWCGAVWAGESRSLDSHLAARAIQALGAGTVETLIPLVVQDMVFIHWRNRAFSAIWAAQGIIIVTLGICSPPIIIATSWRWIYHISAIAAAVSWLVILIALPETRYFRSNAELRGEPAEFLPAGQLRPILDPVRYGPRTWWTEVGVFHFGISWSRAWESFLASIKSFFFPNIFWIICLNGAFSAISLAAGQTGSSVLMTTPNSWPFRLIGLAVLPIVIASVFVAIFAGYAADKLSNFVTRTRYNGRREPEVHLLNVIAPLLFAVAGCVMFGAGGTLIGHISWGVFVVGIGFLAFGVLATNVICGVYIVESYPDWAGAVLVNSGAFRNIIGFGFSFKATTWIGELGFLRMFGIYAAVVAIIGLFGIPVFIYGKMIRRYCGRFIASHEERYNKDSAVTGYESPSIVDEKKRQPIFLTDAPPASKRQIVDFIGTSSTARTVIQTKPKIVSTASSRSRQQRNLNAHSPQLPSELGSRQETSCQAAAESTEQPEEANEKKKGRIDWELVKEYLNMRSKWGDPAMH